MNVSRFVMLAVPLGVVLVYFVMQSLTWGEASNRDMIARGELMEEIKKRSFASLYDTIEQGFPDAYAEHEKKIEEIALDTELSRFEFGAELIEESDEFIAELRADNAGFLATAGRGPLLDIQRALLAILKDLEQTPDLCVAIARDGMDSLDRFELGRINPDLYGRWLLENVKAIIAGRDEPEAFEPPSERDWRVFLQSWRDDTDGVSASVQAYLSADASDPLMYCQGAEAFTRRLIADTTPSGLRILVDYSSKFTR